MSKTGGLSKRVTIILALCTGLICLGCARAGELAGDNAVNPAPVFTASPTAVPIDVDFLSMKPAIAFASAADIGLNPSEYEGKTIRAMGRCVSSRHSPEVIYYYVIVEDEAGCCLEFLEFRLTQNDFYPDDNAIIEISGIIELYENMGDIYCRIAANEMIVLSEG